jgi:hypothetical protein
MGPVLLATTGANPGSDGLQNGSSIVPIRPPEKDRQYEPVLRTGSAYRLARVDYHDGRDVQNEELEQGEARLIWFEFPSLAPTMR